MDFESKPNDGYEDEKPYSNLTRKTGQGLLKRPVVPYLLAGMAALMVVVVLVLFSRGSEKEPLPAAPAATLGSEQLTQLNNRVQTLDKRLALVEKRVADLMALSGKLSAIDGTASTDARRIDLLAAKIEKIESHVTKQLAEQKKAIEKPAKIRSKAVPRHVKTENKTSAGKTEYHVVKKGETLYHIAKVYGISLKSLLAINHLKTGEMIHPGEKLVIRKAK